MGNSWRLRIFHISVFIFCIVSSAVSAKPGLCEVEKGESNIILDIEESRNGNTRQSTAPAELPIVGDPFQDITLDLVFPRDKPVFILNGKKLQLLEPLDRDQENLSHIVFQLMCTVRATKKQRSIPIIVRVSDINDNAPQFVNTPYEVNVSEVIGAIDGTHIPIINPGGEHAQIYINRKGWYSLNVQVICDATFQIIDIVARWRGSAHDSRIFNESIIKARFDRGEFGRFLLLGDSGYAVHPYLLTPLRNPATRAEQHYNASHKTTRNIVERCFGVWKGRFRCLTKNINTHLRTTKRIIVACAVLHNLAVQWKEEMADIYVDDDDDREEHVEGAAEGRGHLFRQRFIQQHF